MNKSELYISRLLFKNKILESDKQSYEDLFVKVMENSNSNFQPVKPQGSFGDRKNDGFDKTTGTFYQVYAPEDLTKVISKAENKLIEDFNGLKKYWLTEGFEIKKFYYVLHDKYKGTYPSLLSLINKIALQNNIEADIFRNFHLEDTFLNLDDNKITGIVGWYPDPLDVQEPDYDIMSQVISHLLDIETPVIQEKIPNDPNFDRKLNFNGLSRHISIYMNAGRIQHHAVKSYFELNSEFVKEDLRQIFTNIYNEGKIIIPDSNTKSDDLFVYIVEKSCPKKTPPYYTIIYILMAYYFEYCDIFETPLDQGGQFDLFDK